MSGRRESPFERRDLLGLASTLVVTLTAVPAAIITVPNASPYVASQAARDLGVSTAAFVRVCGLALPALLAVTPLGAAAVRRLPARVVLLAGLVVLLGAQAVAPYAPSLPLVGAVRVAAGAAAGLVLPATLALAWHPRRRAVAAGVWAATLVGSLLLATPLAGAAAPGPDEPWREVMRPFWWLSAVALAGSVLLGPRRAEAPAGVGRGERAQLLLPAAPVAGLGFTAVAATYGWAPGAQLALAGTAVAGLLALAAAGSGAVPTGSPLGCAVVMVAVGLLTLPVTGPLTEVLGGRGAPVAPFVAGAVSAALAALAAAAFGRETGRGAVLCGYGMSAAAIVLLLLMGPADRWTPLLPLCVLGTGTGMAAGAALRHTQPAAALYGLSLCFPAVLGGRLIVGSLQAVKMGPAPFQVWLVAAGALVAVHGAATAWVSRARVGSTRPSATSANR